MWQTHCLSPLPLQSAKYPVCYKLFSASSLNLAFRDLQLATREVFKITSSSDTTPPPACLLHFLCSTLQQLYLHCPLMAHCDCSYFVVKLQ
jgi:hypothetical protein